MDAVNDWPSPIESLEDYAASVETFIGNVPNKKNIEFYANHSDVSKYAWEMESLSQIISLFNADKSEVKDITLIEIINKLRNQLINEVIAQQTSDKGEFALEIFEKKLFLQKSELLDLIEIYFKSEISVEKLSDYSWETINFFMENKKILPPYQENEKPFWYAIWQLQHLSDEEHEKDGSLSRALKDIVMYLKNQKELPNEYEGRRP